MKKTKKIKKKVKKLRPALKRKKRRKKFRLPRGRPKKVFLEDKLQQLIKKGRERGFVTISEILYFFPEVERDIKGLEELYSKLEKEGIEVKEAKELISLPEEKKEKS